MARSGAVAARRTADLRSPDSSAQTMYRQHSSSHRPPTSTRIVPATQADNTPSAAHAARSTGVCVARAVAVTQSRTAAGSASTGNPGRSCVASSARHGPTAVGD